MLLFLLYPVRARSMPKLAFGAAARVREGPNAREPASRPSSRIARVVEETLSIVSELREDAHYVAPSGELDIATVELLERALLEVERADSARIVLDLSGLSFIDSTGLRLLLDVNERCGGAADRLRVIAGSPAIERLLDIVGLRERLPLIAP